MKNKKNFFAMVFVMSMLFSVSFFQIVFAASKEIKVRIENSNKTEASGVVYADTFLEAVQKLGVQKNIEIILGTDSNTSFEIISVNDKKNKEKNPQEYWRGYILRNGTVITENNIFSNTLLNGDEVVLYYGDDQTKPIGLLKEETKENQIQLTANYHYVGWINKDEIPVAKEIIQPVKGIKIHLKTPDGLEQISATDKLGKAIFDIQKVGYYTYYAEGYNNNAMPSIVKTAEKRILIGIENSNTVTRGEFAALLNAKYNFSSQENFENIQFKDIENYKYKKEIQQIVSEKIMSGSSVNTFEPDKKITLMEAAVVLSRFYHDEEIEIENINNVESWAQKGIAIAKKNGILNGVEENFNSFVSVDMIETMLHNMNIERLVGR